MHVTKTKPLPGALFAVNMLVATDGGGTFTFAEFAQDLTSSGFTNIELVHQGQAMDSLVRARKGRQLVRAHAFGLNRRLRTVLGGQSLITLVLSNSYGSAA